MDWQVQHWLYNVERLCNLPNTVDENIKVKSEMVNKKATVDSSRFKTNKN